LANVLAYGREPKYKTMKIIYRAANIVEAHILSGLLQSRGVDAYVGGQYLQGGIGELAALDSATLSVEDIDEEAAKAVLAEYERGDLSTIRESGADD